MRLTAPRTAIGLTGIILAVVALGGWYVFIRDNSPPPPSLQTAAIAAAGTSAAGGASDASGESNTSASVAADLTGAWQLVDGPSFVGYRVQEELARIGATTAVGRTTAVTGALVFDGASITDVTIEADLSKLASDESFRDQALRRQALETGTYPTASFALTSPIELDGVPTEGETIAATAQGDLTLHGVTKAITIPLEGQLVNGQAIIVGSLEIEFADYDIDPPSAASVVSVEDHGTLELQLVFAQA
jgi:polyisoprenoid-binding protein YceI